MTPYVVNQGALRSVYYPTYIGVPSLIYVVFSG